MVDWAIFAAVVIVVIIVAATVGAAIGSIKTKPLEGKCQFSPAVCGWGRTLGIPDFFLSNRNFIFYFLMPVGAIGAIVYGFLDRIGLFYNKAVKVSIAVFIALACIPTQVITLLAATLLTILGGYAVAAFVVVFVVGVVLVSATTLGGLKARNIKDTAKAVEEAKKISFNKEKLEVWLNELQRLADASLSYGHAEDAAKAFDHIDKARKLLNKGEIHGAGNEANAAWGILRAYKRGGF